MAQFDPTNVTHSLNSHEQLGRVIIQRQNYHTLPSADPVQSSGKALVEWYRSLFGALSTLGTLGAGFTLSVVVQDSHQPNRAGFPPETVNTWAAISSILFVLTVLVAQGFSQLFKFEQITIAEGIDDDDRCIQWWLYGLSLLLQGQVLGAFLFLELVLAAHSPTVGWIGVSITSFLGLIATSLWLVQASGRKSVAQYRRYVINKNRKERSTLAEQS